MCMEEHLLGVVNPLNESQYLEGLVSDSRPDDTRGKKKKSDAWIPIWFSIYIDMAYTEAFLYPLWQIDFKK